MDDQGNFCFRTLPRDGTHLCPSTSSDFYIQNSSIVAAIAGDCKFV